MGKVCRALQFRQADNQGDAASDPRQGADPLQTASGNLQPGGQARRNGAELLRLQRQGTGHADKRGCRRDGRR